MRDPRILLGCVSALIIVFAFAWRSLRRGTAPAPSGASNPSRFSLGDRVPRVLRGLGENLVHLSLSCRSRGHERSSGSRGPAGPAWGARPALDAVGPLRAGLRRRLANDAPIRAGTAPRPAPRRSPSNCRPSSRTRWCSFLILSPTASSCLQCRVPCARSASITISSIPAARPAVGHHRGGRSRSSGSALGRRRSPQFPGRGRRLAGQPRARAWRMRCADDQHGASQDLQTAARVAGRPS